MEQSVEGAEREPLEADRPIQTADQDRFGRWEFSKRIAQVIVGRRDASSLVVGVYAPWGDGKTSVLNMIMKELEKHEDRIVVVRFNPWRFQGESHLLKNFFEVLAERLGKSLKTRGEKVSEFFKAYADVLAPVSFFGVDPTKPIKALTNVRRHAAASQVDVILRYTDNAVELEVRDNGSGSTTDKDAVGHGLIGMRERAALYGGRLETASSADAGFTVRATLPVAWS